MLKYLFSFILLLNFLSQDLFANTPDPQTTKVDANEWTKNWVIKNQIKPGQNNKMFSQIKELSFVSDNSKTIKIKGLGLLKGSKGQIGYERTFKVKENLETLTISFEFTQVGNLWGGHNKPSHFSVYLNGHEVLKNQYRFFRGQQPLKTSHQRKLAESMYGVKYKQFKISIPFEVDPKTGEFILQDEDRQPIKDKRIKPLEKEKNIIKIGFGTDMPATNDYQLGGYLISNFKLFERVDPSKAMGGSFGNGYASIPPINITVIPLPMSSYGAVQEQSQINQETKETKENEIDKVDKVEGASAPSEDVGEATEARGSDINATIEINAQNQSQNPIISKNQTLTIQAP